MEGPGATNTKFAEAIENEHTTMFGCDMEFTTSNYLVTTTPRKEYEIAMGRRECPDGDMLDRKGRRVRVIQSIDTLRTLDICRRAGLKDYEILAVVRARELIYPRGRKGGRALSAVSHSSAVPGTCCLCTATRTRPRLLRYCSTALRWRGRSLSACMAGVGTLAVGGGGGGGGGFHPAGALHGPHVPGPPPAAHRPPPAANYHRHRRRNQLPQFTDRFLALAARRLPLAAT